MRDYAQAGLGAAIFGAPLVLAGPNVYVAVILGAIVLVFVWFGLTTWRRQRSVIVVTDAAISVEGPSSARIFWPDVKLARLRYFPMGRAQRREGQREQGGGVMQVRLDSEDASIRFDSSLEEFETVARQVADAIHRHDLATAPATKTNFAALGLAPDASWAEEV